MSLSPQELLPSFRRGALIYNPQAGELRRKPDKITSVINALRNQGIEVQQFPTRGLGDAKLIAQSLINSGCDLLVACGGDGTINEIVCGIAGSRLPLMIFPAGTANVLARELGLPLSNVEECARLLRTGFMRRVSLGLAGTRHFALMAGIGVDAGVVEAVNLALKRRIGQGAFWLAGFQQLFKYHFLPFELWVDGVRLKCTFALVSKAKFYASRFQLTPCANLYSDTFEVCAFHGLKRWRYLTYLFSALLGRHHRLKDVTILHGKSIRASGPAEIKVQVDGELLGNLPQAFSIQMDALTLIAPGVQQQEV
jgi:YegS/Rv2252/BmrU family lipid kinase